MKVDFSLWHYKSILNDNVDDYIRANIELGITVSFSPEGNGTKESDKRMLYFLDACKANGMTAIVSDRRLFYKKDENGYKLSADGKRCLDTFMGHEAVHSFFVCDEPKPEICDSVGAYARQVTEYGAVPFINYYPFLAGQEKHYGSAENYEKYLADFTKKYAVPIVAYDRYSQMFAEKPFYKYDFLEDGVDKYFRDLNLHKSVAKKTGVPLWTSLLACGHWAYRTPSRDDIRWQINTAIAHGVDGIQWFFPFEHVIDEEYYEVPVTYHGRKTELYYQMCDMTKYAVDSLLAPLKGYTFDSVFHITKCYGATPDISAARLPFQIIALHGLNGILTRYTKDGDVQYVLTNNSQYREKFHFNYEGTEYGTWLAPGGTHFIKHEKLGLTKLE